MRLAAALLLTATLLVGCADNAGCDDALATALDVAREAEAASDEAGRAQHHRALEREVLAWSECYQ